MQLRVAGLKEYDGFGYLLPEGGHTTLYDPHTMKVWMGSEAPSSYKPLRIIANFDTKEFEFWSYGE